MIFQATQQLLDELPSYAELTRTAASPGPTGLIEPQVKEAALWMSDSILAARVQFLMSVLGPCLPSLPQVRFLMGSSQVAPDHSCCVRTASCGLIKTKKALLNYKSWKNEAFCEKVVVAADVVCHDQG